MLIKEKANFIPDQMNHGLLDSCTNVKPAVRVMFFLLFAHFHWFATREKNKEKPTVSRSGASRACVYVR